ncbi:MAG: hypothetical protein OQK69_08720 [Gammaproteobacteria bacterium]|nr:hypothetical protein [Gammaproteobacteria bacterium]
MNNYAHWSAQFVGLPYEQLDCAQLCVKVQKEIFNRDIELPADRADGLRGISQQITDLQADYAEPVPLPEEGDAVLMVGRGRLNHIGICCFINNQLWVLHAMKNTGQTVLHRVPTLESLGLRVEGYYQWK